MKKTMKKAAAAVIAAVTVCGLVTGCSAKEEKIEVNTSTSSYEDMVSYFEQEGFISEDCEPVNINETSGYLQDNTGGQFTETQVADKAYDYDGLWLFWWDQENQTEMYETTSPWERIRERSFLEEVRQSFRQKQKMALMHLRFQRIMRKSRMSLTHLKHLKMNKAEFT